MPDFNKYIGVGNHTRDPELRDARGTPVCNFDIAINRRWKGRDGQTHEETTYVPVTAWGPCAENVDKYLRKGSPVLVEGRLDLERWEQDGKNRQRLKVTAERVVFLGQPSGQSDRRSRQRPEPAASDGPTFGDDLDDDLDDEPIPF